MENQSHNARQGNMAAPSRPQAPEGGFWLVKVNHSNETMLCMPGGLDELKIAEKVVVPTKYGLDLAEILGRIKAENGGKWEEVVEMVRRASPHDVETYEANLPREKDALKLCRAKIDQHQLDMKLVSVHFMLDEPKIVFFFTSDNRVDFRDLVKDLVAVFHLRIELRQIGVRDESRVVGGLGVCGRSLCCNHVSDKLQPVSIKMAKIQNLSLNSMKISGPCGRLLCCLAYEYDAYKSDRRDLPQEGMGFTIEGANYTVRDVNVLSRLVYLHSEDGRQIAVPAKFFRQESNGYWRFTETSLLNAQVVPATPSHPGMD